MRRSADHLRVSASLRDIPRGADGRFNGWPAVISAWLLLLVCAAGVSHACADDLLTRYYAGLRERGLFRLAESDCQRRLENAHLSPGGRVVLSIELSQAYADHAAQRTGQEREELWGRALHVLDELQRFELPDGYRELVSAQRGFVDVGRGAQLRWQVELFPLDDRDREQAVTILRRGIETLQPLPAALGERLSASLAQTTRNRDAQDLPPPFRYRELRRTVEFRAAVAAVDLAKVLTTGPDRAAALQRAAGALRELTKTPLPDEAAWIAEVLLIELSRMQGDLDRVGPQVAALLAKDPPPPIRDASVAQWVRADLDAGRPDAALERLQLHRKEHGTAADELTSLLVESLLAARRVAADKRQQQDLAQDLLAQAESYAANSSGAWGARSRVLIDTAREAETYGPELADSVRRANWAWKNGDLEKAIDAFHQAVGQAHRSGRAEFAVELAITLATLQSEARRFDAAVATLTGLLDNYADSPRAAEAHLLRAYALGRQFELKADEPQRQAYRLALEEHRQRYADSPTTVEATWMLARLEEHERNWPAAIELLKSIPAESKRSADAQMRLAVVFELALADLAQRGEPTEDWRQQAIAELRQVLDKLPPAPAPLTEVQTEIAWRLARLVLGQSPPDFALGNVLLQRVLQRESSPDVAASDSKHAHDPAKLARPVEALQLRMICLAGLGELEAARQALREMEQTQPERLLDVLDGLSSAAQHVGLEQKHIVGQLQLELSQSLDARRETLSDAEKQTLDASLAQAHAALGQFPQAAAVYEKLIWQQPQNAKLIESLARLYVSCGTVSCLRNASKQWQALERLQGKGSPEWLESRYYIAWCSHRLGDDESARKMIGVTRVLYPDFGNAALKARFEELAAQLPAERRQK